MKTVNFVGYSGAGKTTLVEKLITIFSGKGYKVAAIKDTHHNVELDKPGKDSFRFKEAGATKVIVRSGDRWALMVRDEIPPTLDRLFEEVRDSDIVFIEGFKSEGRADLRLEVWRDLGEGRRRIYLTDSSIAGVISDQKNLDNCCVPVLDVNDPEGIAKWVEARLFDTKED